MQGEAMAGVTGLGGAFLRASDPEAMYKWYEKHLGLKLQAGTFMFEAAQQRAHSVVAFFPRASEYFPVGQAAMLNFQVDDLDALLDRLIADGVVVDPHRERCEYGNFGWLIDLEGNRVELWQPV
jgi:predicted enzyme related to lactoylglutathione lyase